MRRAGLLLGAALGFAALATRIAPTLERVTRSWPQRVAIEGHSMEPTLRDGDWLLVDPHAYLGRAPIATELAVFHDPRQPKRLLVKRVVSVTAEGGLIAKGDHLQHQLDPGLIGEVAPRLVVGRPWFRYRPIGRIGRVQ